MYTSTSIKTSVVRWASTTEGPEIEIQLKEEARPVTHPPTSKEDTIALCCVLPLRDHPRELELELEDVVEGALTHWGGGGHMDS